jgi:hypothetical protein
MRGTPRAYPQDRYIALHDQWIETQDGRQLEIKTRLSAATHLRLAYSAHAERISGAHFRASREAFIDRFKIKLARPNNTVQYVYAIALAPVALLVSVGLYILRSRSTTIFSVEAGVAVLALLPLRQVLVPSEVSVLTRVDLLLAGEALLFITIAAAGSLFPSRKLQETDVSAA